jgi:outer membrane murein-binding lipoprotein Lpp
VATVTGSRTSIVLLCPHAQATRPTMAAIAELSAELGSLEAAYAKLGADREEARAKRQAAADAERGRLRETFFLAARRAEAGRRYLEWKDSPLQIPDWAIRGIVEGWPEPDVATVERYLKDVADGRRLP